MKKYLIALGIPLVLLGCSPFSSNNADDMPKPAVQSISTMSAETFYFNAGESGLTLFNTDDDNFSIELSSNSIGDANIIDGVLTFTELLDQGENVRVINLKAYAESL